MYTRDIERLARSLAAQKCEPDYIRHYLQDTYQLDNPSIDQIFRKLGIPLATPKGKGKAAGPAAANGDKQADRRNRQGF